MTRTRGLLLAILAVLVAVWVSSSATMPLGRAPQGSPPVAAAGAPEAPSAFELDEVARRLRSRVSAGDAGPKPAARNPFRFAGARAPRDPVPAVPAETTVAEPAGTAAPAVSLIGIVERTVDGKPVRVAVVSMADQLSYVSAGDRLGSTFEVVAVGADAIELKDTSDGSTRRLALR